MKILYVGQLDPGGTCFARLRGLREMESDVATFDILEHIAGGSLARWQRGLEFLTLRGPRIKRANAAVLAAARAARPSVVWIDKGDWVWPSTLRALRDGGAFLVHHNTDALWPRSRSLRFKRRLLSATARYFDAFLTTNEDDRDRIAGTGVTEALLTDLGYDDTRFEPSPLAPQLREKWSDALLFVGHHEPSTEAGVLALVEAGLPVTVYGNRYWFASANRARLGDRLRPSLGDEDYVHALKGAQIGLCFVSRLNYNQTASRSFEIPACGTFLLAVRTRGHQACYEEGREAEFFGDHDELVQKARYFLEHDDERETIARRGTERCLSSGYSWTAIMKRDWPRVLELYDRRRVGDRTLETAPR